MIAWTIDAALKSGIFDKVLVSTDSEEIAAVSRNLGASVPFLRQGVQMTIVLQVKQPNFHSS